MAKIELKKKVDKEWITIPLANILGNSIVNYINTSEDELVAAMFQNDKPVLFVTNSETIRERVKDRGICFMSQEMIELMGTAVYHPVLLKIDEVFKPDFLGFGEKQ